MKINLKSIKVRDLVNGYKDSGDSGVVGYSGKLDVRPAYQREFVYKGKERSAVIETVLKGFPLNVMYWVVNKDAQGNETYEVLDGQQRTLSICQYVNIEFSLNEKYFHNLPKNLQDDILNYELMVYFCEGTESEKLEWFKTINIAGVKLTEQELRNSIYTGPWLASAKEYFSKNNCVAYQLGSKYLTGSPIRQDYLETVLGWVNNGNIEGYMAAHQLDKDSDSLRQYFKKVINWIELNFPIYRKEMTGLDWGSLYNSYNTKTYNSNDLEKRINELMLDDDVGNKKGIYEFLLSGEKLRKCLNIRIFSDKDKAQAFEKQLVAGTGKATCPQCNDNTKLYTLKEMEADHIIPWSKGGKTIGSNCQMLCKFHNGTKSNN